MRRRLTYFLFASDFALRDGSIEGPNEHDLRGVSSAHDRIVHHGHAGNYRAYLTVPLLNIFLRWWSETM